MAGCLPARRQDTVTRTPASGLPRFPVVYNKSIMAVNRVYALCWREVGMCKEGSKATVTVTSPLTLSFHHASARNKVEPLECAKQSLLFVSSVPLLL